VKPPLRKKGVFYGWYIVAASVAINFYLSIVFFQGFQVFFLPILQEFGWTRALTSGAFSLRQLESGLLAPIMGFMVDRWGPRIVILIGVILGGVGMIMLSYVNSLWSFYLAFLLASLGVSGASHGVSWAVAVANWFSRLQGRALGIAMLGPVVGGPFVVLVAVMDENLGWRTALFILGIGLWVVGIPLALVARSDPYSYGYLPDGDTADPIGKTENIAGFLEQETSGFTVVEALKTRDFWCLLFLFAAFFIGVSGLMVHLIPLLQDLDYSATEAAGVVGLIFLLSGIGRVGAGTLADMIGYRKIILFLIFSEIISLLLLVRVEPSQPWLLGAFSLLFGIGFGGTIPLRPFLIMRMFGSRSFGAIQGMVQGGAIGAGVLGPVLYGWVFDHTNSYDLAIYASIFTIIAGIPALYLLKEHR
jgi:MFS family permease